MYRKVLLLVTLALVSASLPAKVKVFRPRTLVVTDRNYHQTGTSFNPRSGRKIQMGQTKSELHIAGNMQTAKASDNRTAAQNAQLLLNDTPVEVYETSEVYSKTEIDNLVYTKTEVKAQLAAEAEMDKGLGGWIDSARKESKDYTDKQVKAVIAAINQAGPNEVNDVLRKLIETEVARQVETQVESRLREIEKKLGLTPQSKK